jgi:hypothetical protein
MVMRVPAVEKAIFLFATERRHRRFSDGRRHWLNRHLQNDKLFIEFLPIIDAEDLRCGLTTIF